MNSETLTQAALQGLKVFLVAGLTALGANASGIVQVGTAGDPLVGPLALSVISAVIVAILKAIGGPTEQPDVQVGRGAGRIRRPNFFSV